VPTGYVYIMSADTHRLYVGSTTNLIKRVYEHKTRYFEHAFTARYTFDRLVYFEVLPTIEEARAREQQIKGWLRKRKIALIESVNPRWHDLSQSWANIVRSWGRS
jgi:putative endonuclease